MKRFLLAATLAFASATATKAQSAAIFSNLINGSNPNNDNPFTTGQTVAPTLTATGIGRGPGIAGTNATGRYNANGFGTSTFDADDYFTFTMTPTAGNKLTLASLTFTAQRSSSGPVSASVRTSVDNFASDVATFALTGTAANSFSADFPYASNPAFESGTAAIEVRIYAWNGTAGGTFSINDFAFSGKAFPLPLNLLSFAAQRSGDAVKASWTTAEETQVRHIELQRSGNGAGFETVATVAATNTPGEHHYEALDAQPLAGRSFYRLATVDFNGSTSYSQTIVMNTSKEASVSLAVSPNPVQRSFSLLHSAAAAGARIVVAGLDGKIVAVRQPVEGSTTTAFTDLDLPTGAYIASFENGGEKVTAHFVR